MAADLVAQESHVNLQRVGLAAKELKVVLRQGRLKRDGIDGAAFIAVSGVRDCFLNEHVFTLLQYLSGTGIASRK